MMNKLASRLGFVVVALLLVAAGAQGEVTVDVTQSVGGDGMYPTTGGTIDVTVSMTASGTGSLLSLTVVDAIPAGWSYNSMVTAPASGMLMIQPPPGTTGQLDYVWLTPPTFPASFTFRLNVPAGESGDKAITLSGSYNGGTANDTAFGPTATTIPPAPVMVNVPILTGLNQTDATSALTAVGLIVGAVTQANSDTVAAGLVMSQDPASGTSVEAGSAVDFVISLGPCMTTVPNVVGATQEAAGTALNGATLTLGTVTQEYSTTVAAGLVISQNPTSGASVHCNSSVAIVISLGPCMTTVPNVVGSTQAAATTALNSATLTLGTVTQEYSTTVAVGLVISQNPTAGANVACNASVALVVSLGPCMTTVPNVVGSTQEAAGTALAGASLTVGTTVQQYSDTVAAGLVISQNPVAGASVACNSAVALVVSKGACTTTVPNVVGSTESVATTALTNATLTLGAVTEQYSDTVEAGLVISQNPGSGVEVSCNTAVALVLSLGPCVATVPNVVGMTAEAAATALTGASLTPGTVTQEYSDTVAAGLVISQDPLADASVPCATLVALVVSRGPCMVTMPQVVGLSEASAVAAIEAVGLSVTSIDDDYSATVAAGNVISQDPAADESVPCGSQAALVVSMGPEPNEVCPDDTLFGQAPEVPLGGYFVSDLGAAVLIYDNFDFGKLDAPVGDIHWWGYALDATLGACDRSPDTYSIRFYASKDGAPGTLACAYEDVEPSVTELPYTTWNGTPLYRFDVALPSICSLQAGWVSIQGTSDLGCRFAWAVSADGDGNAYLREVDATPATILYDMAFCLTAAGEIEVPNVVGMPDFDAEAILDSVGLAVGQVTEEYSDTVLAGWVISQDPAAGTMVFADAAVDLVVSLGPCLVNVPDITGLSYDDAVAALEAVDLAMGGFTYEYSDTVPADYIISQDPAAGTEVPCETTVDVVKSLGPCLATVPDAVGSAFADAVAAIEGAGLTLGEVTEIYNDQFAAGEVISQLPVAGQEVACGSAVNLVVSLGVCEVAMPDLVGMPIADAQAALEALSLYIATSSIEFSDTIPAGQVISQTPAPGTVLPCGSGVDVVRSAGSCVTNVPDLTGASETTAATALQVFNLTLGNITQEYSAEVPAGIVIGQNPAPNEQVPCLTPVDLVLSLGACVVTVPDVVGAALLDAEAAIANADLLLGQVMQAASDTVPAGFIISQDPAAGVDAPCSSAVNLVVSSGPCNAMVPDVVGLPLFDAEVLIPNASLMVGSVSYELSGTVAAGLVISQSPSGGDEVLCGTAVDLVVSLGACVAGVPNVVGMDQTAAEAALGEAQLVLGQVTEAYSDTVIAGGIISQDPAAGVQVSCDTAVNVVLSLGPCTALVPDVAGQTPGDAEAALVAAGLVLGQVTEASSSTVPAGQVISSSPSFGETVPCGSPVAIVVSLGAVDVEVPVVAGLSQSAAEAEVTSAGLETAVELACDNTVPAGTVISQTPAAGSVVPPGTVVILLVSIGACTVPDLTGVLEATAEEMLVGMGLTVGQVTYGYSDTIPAGSVVETYPVAGTAVDPGATVDLMISLGACMTDVPNVVGSTETAAVTALTGSLLTLGAVTQENSATVPAGLVIAQDPPAGSNVVCGTAVALVLSLGSCMTDVPNVAGLTEVDAATALTASLLTLGAVTQENSDTVPAGLVIAQNPPAGSNVACGTAVALVLSLGPCVTNVPDVTGLTEAEATAALANAMLTLGAVGEENSETVPAGLVIDQAPAADTEVPCNTAVSLLISLGPCMTTVPDVVGLPAEEAAAALADALLTPGDVTTAVSETVPAGAVISLDPAAGTEVPCNTAVAVVVSLGPCTTVVPAVLGLTKTAATTVLEDAGLTLGAVRRQYSDTVVAGLVIDQDPIAGAEAVCGSAVDVTISRGPVPVPDAPVNVQASDGDYGDRVKVTWDAVDGGLQYKVYRSETADLADAILLGRVWAPSHEFNDFTAVAGVAPDGITCKGGTYTEYYYWVSVRIAATYSEAGGPDVGYRGIDDGQKSAVYESVMPAQTLESGTQAVLPDGQLAIRLRSEEPMDAASVWGVVTSSLGETDAVAWLPVDEDGLDGWVVFVPETPWVVGDVITMTAGANTASGEAVGPIVFVFEVVEGGAAKAALAELAGVKAADGGVGAVYEVGPDEAYAETQRIWLPVPAGVAADSVALYYYHSDAADAGWYLADDVAGWLVAGSYEVAEVDGVGYLGFDVRHGGIVQLVVSADIANQGAAAIPTSGVLGDLLTLVVAGVVLLGFGSRFSRARQGLDQ